MKFYCPETFSSMVDKINILTEIFCKEDNIEMLDVTELDDEGLYCKKDFFLLISILEFKEYIEL